MSYNEESGDRIEDCDVEAEKRRVAKNDAGDVLKIDALTKVFASFSRRQKVVAVDGVTLGIHRGEVSHKIVSHKRDKIKSNNYEKSRRS